VLPLVSGGQMTSNVLEGASAIPVRVTLMLALSSLPLLFRRWLPWPVFVVTIAIFAWSEMVLYNFSFSAAAVCVALYTITRQRSIAEATIALVVAIFVVIVSNISGGSQGLSMLFGVQNIAFFALAVAIGYAHRSHENYQEEAERRKAETQAMLETEAAKRVEEERVRIAREIHDITAHSLSAVSIQATAAKHVIDSNPDTAKEMIEEVRQTSKTALDEIRSMIGFLRNEAPESETAPTYGLSHLPDLVEYAQSAGLSVNVQDQFFSEKEIPAYANVALFGIAREAITNCVRHAQAQNLKITLYTDIGAVYMRIEDDGVGMTKTKDEISGHGLRGMEERITALDGTFSAGNLPTGGFYISVSIPLTNVAEHEETIPAAAPTSATSPNSDITNTSDAAALESVQLSDAPAAGVPAQGSATAQGGGQTTIS